MTSREWLKPDPIIRPRPNNLDMLLKPSGRFSDYGTPNTARDKK
jgi:hypothetical protein